MQCEHCPGLLSQEHIFISIPSVFFLYWAMFIQHKEEADKCTHFKGHLRVNSACFQCVFFFFLCLCGKKRENYTRNKLYLYFATPIDFNGNFSFNISYAKHFSFLHVVRI